MNDITSRPQLTSGEQARIDAAAEILAAEHGYDATALAERLGVLDWHGRSARTRRRTDRGAR